MGNKSTTFGSDIDGYAATPLKPTDARKFVNYTDGVPTGDQLTRSRMGGASPRVWNYNTEGMAHIGLVPDFFEALKKDGMSLEKLNQLFLSAEYFAQMWEKCLARAPLVER
jgi:microsomal dipeptidase-like Zn-dependent dipeptidase